MNNASSRHARPVDHSLTILKVHLLGRHPYGFVPGES
jgi:hypothetical protein